MGRRLSGYPRLATPTPPTALYQLHIHLTNSPNAPPTIDFSSQEIEFPSLELVVALHRPLFHKPIDDGENQKQIATIIHYSNGISHRLRFGIRPGSYTPPLAYLSYSGIEARLRAISLIVVLFSPFLLVLVWYFIYGSYSLQKLSLRLTINPPGSAAEPFLLFFSTTFHSFTFNLSPFFSASPVYDVVQGSGGDAVFPFCRSDWMWLNLTNPPSPSVWVLLRRGAACSLAASSTKSLELREGLAATTGYSQDIVDAAATASAFAWNPCHYIMSCAFTILCWIGCCSQQTYPHISLAPSTLQDPGEGQSANRIAQQSGSFYGEAGSCGGCYNDPVGDAQAYSFQTCCRGVRLCWLSIEICCLIILN